MIKPSEHFTLAELTKTQQKLLNAPSWEQCINLCCLAHYILEPLRAQLEQPVIINSAFRSPAVNKAVGGVPNSQHIKGCAADIRVNSEEHGMKMFKIVTSLKYADQVLFEHSGKTRWLHVSFSYTPRKLFNPNYKV